MVAVRLASLLVLASALAPHQARAHAALVEASPPDGAILAEAPPALRLTFDEGVTLVFLHLLDGAGRELLPEGAAAATDSTVEARPPPLASGSYILSYRVVSADGHPVGGALQFRVGAAASPEAAPAEKSSEPAWRAVAAAARFLLYGALLAASGGALFLALVIRDRPALHAGTRRYARGAAAVAAMAALLTLGTEGGLLTLPPFPSGLVDAAAWSAGAGSPQGGSVALSLLGLALLGAALRWLPARPLLLAGAAISLAGLAATGHAATAPPRWLATPTVLLHALVAALWIGSLWPLAGVLRTASPDEGAAIVQRFSASAAAALALLVASGTCLAVMQVGRSAALIETNYGRFLLAKLGFVLALCLCAAFNKWRLTPALSGLEPGKAARRLRRSIGLELGLAAVVLAATVALGMVPPPRALRLPEGVSVALVSPHGIEMHLRVAPALAGRNTIEVAFTRDGTPLDPAEATLELSLPEAGIEPLAQPMARVGPGAFRVDNAELAPPGTWHARIEALVGDFEREAYQTAVIVRPRAP